MIISAQAREKLSKSLSSANAIVLLACKMQDRLLELFPIPELVVGSLKHQEANDWNVLEQENLYLSFSFSGSGDSGDIDAPDVNAPTDYYRGEIRADDPLYTMASDFIYQHASWDWYNNDGGGGTLIVYPNNPQSSNLSGYYRETQDIDCDDGICGDNVEIPEDE